SSDSVLAGPGFSDRVLDAEFRVVTRDGPGPHPIGSDQREQPEPRERRAGLPDLGHGLVGVEECAGLAVNDSRSGGHGGTLPMVEVLAYVRADRTTGPLSCDRFSSCAWSARFSSGRLEWAQGRPCTRWQDPLSNESM